MSNRTIVVIGASAGGVAALQQLVATLPPDFPAALFISIHFPEHGTSVLPQILARAGPLPARHARDGEPIVAGRIYVAPPDHHLLLTPGAVRVVRGPKENGNRPAIDPMFRSAAVAFGSAVIGVVLTGNLDDGTSGLAAIKRAGGATIVQDPNDAAFPSMPQSAIEHVAVDSIVPLNMIGAALARLMAEPLPDSKHSIASDDVRENAFAAGDLAVMEDPRHHPGTVSAFGCPDCGGVLWELKDGDFARYRCRVGHAWTADALLDEQSAAVDEALWTALRALEESAALSRQMARRHEARGMGAAGGIVPRLVAQADEAQRQANVIRNSLMKESATHDASAVAERE